MKLLTLLAFLFAASAFAKPPKGNTAATEEEQMIDEFEAVNKTLQSTISKLSGQISFGSQLAGKSAGDTNAALEQMQKQLAKSGGGAALSGAPTDPNSFGALQQMIQNLTKQMMQNVNQSVDKLNKLSEEVE